MSLPQSNAFLLEVHGVGEIAGDRTDEWENVDPTDTVDSIPEWAGRVPAYLQEKRLRTAGDAQATGEDYTLSRSVLVESDEPAVAYREGTVLVLEWDGAVVRGTVGQVERRPAPAGAGYMGGAAATRLTLSDLQG
jgi:hypothetical protein